MRKEIGEKIAPSCSIRVIVLAMRFRMSVTASGQIPCLRSARKTDSCGTVSNALATSMDAWFNSLCSLRATAITDLRMNAFFPGGSHLAESRLADRSYGRLVVGPTGHLADTSLSLSG
ncbi:hypothetical protein M514_13426 [Trichuris suis]|uniref:Uncharacterized protein n=1 Tax=Trichuris suis TaxID=68888 RepID=A0A085LL40_9BILA|nr:hypothetical protein M513_13426 [Trichuris suis]KFD60509.1 hypothetical protein M514_27296 [Trichuris suis]KFD60513.1 hypothetical protein M514_13426 [Trichuris suis]